MSTNCSLLIQFDDYPSQINWFVEERQYFMETTKVLGFIEDKKWTYQTTKIAESLPRQYDNATYVRSRIVEHFTIKDGTKNYFTIQDSAGNGISCKDPPCFKIFMDVNPSENSSPIDASLAAPMDAMGILVVQGNETFRCMEEYEFGTDLQPLRKPTIYACSKEFGFFFWIATGCGFLIVFLLGTIIFRVLFGRGNARIAGNLDPTTHESSNNEIDTRKKEKILAALTGTVYGIDHENQVTSTELACSICLEPFQDGDEVCGSSNIECKHIFHKFCIADWLVRTEACPMCRSAFLFTP